MFFMFRYRVVCTAPTVVGSTDRFKTGKTDETDRHMHTDVKQTDILSLSRQTDGSYNMNTKPKGQVQHQ